MWRLLIARSWQILLQLNQAVLKHFDLSGQSVNDVPLAGYHLRKILDSVGLMRDLDFQINNTALELLCHWASPLLRLKLSCIILGG